VEISADYKDMIHAGTKQEIETKRKVDGWQSLAEKPSDQIIDLAA
jgi:hypothetical protein